jgi:hypothetical protein
VKSGYSQLPLGLYNDNINYDRQYTYEEMYKLVKEEFDKLTPDEEDELDKRTDNHEGGQEEGENMDEGEDESGEGGKPSKGKGEGKPSGKAGDEEGESGSGVSKSILDKIDEHYRNSEKALSEKEDLTPQEAAAKEKEKAAGKAAGKGGRGTGGNTETKLMDMSGGEAHYAWRELIRKFIATAAEPEPEETRARPARNIGSTMHTVMQGGMAAAPPGEVLTEDNDTKLCFVVDSSGSMSGAVKDIYANINSLLSNNSRIGNKIFAMLRFSETYEMFRAIFKGNKAVKVNDFKEIPSKFDLRLDTVFNSHYGSSTNLTSTIVDELLVLKKAGYNLILFSDSDVCSGENLDELASLVRAPGGKVFIILKSKSDWSMLEKSGKIDMTFVSNLYDEVQH